MERVRDGLILLAKEGLNAVPLVLRGHGQVLLSEDIQFDNVPIVTPNGDILLKNLTFNVKPGVSRIHDLYTLDLLNSTRRSTC